MFGNYLKITLRNLYREKLYAIINIFGLSLGIGCCLLLGLYINNELSYDRHFTNHQNIYRVVNEYNFSGKADQLAISSRALGPLLLRDYPDSFTSYTRFQSTGNGRPTVFRDGVKSFYWEDVYLVDVNVFDIFSHDILYGDPEGALIDPLSIAVSESFAITYFGEENPIGETLSTDTAQYRITLVFADLPKNTHLKYDVLISYNRLGVFPDNEAQLQQMLGNISDFTYLTIHDNIQESSFNHLFDEFEEKRFEAMAAAFDMNDSFSADLWVEKLTDIHLNSNLDMDRPTGNKFSLYGFSAVAIFILVIACINYINLATARSLKRAREVGMRKVMGAQRGQLVWQFLGESLFFVVLATAIGLIGVQLLLDNSNIDDLLGAQLSLSVFLGQPVFLVGLVGAAVLIGLISGLYPAFYLSSVVPVIALSSSKGNKGNAGRLRQFLVFTQFTISIGIISSTLLMANQMNYISTMSLGFDKENKLIVPLRGADVIERSETLINELLANPDILNVAAAANIPGGQIGLNGLNIESQSGEMELQSVSAMRVGPNFLETMDIELLEGRDFKRKLLTDVGVSFVVNETLVQRMGWDQALGKRIESGGGGMVGTVRGVVGDFNYASLYQQVAPLIIMETNNDFSNANANNRALQIQTLIINITGNNVPATLNFVRDLMVEFDPTHPFEFEFLDDNLDQQYQSQQSIMQLTAIFAGICVFISCLGLFGLASFTTAQRTREIGVRKVLGASSGQIITLLSRNILQLVLIASVVASIGSWFAIDQWLTVFEYRISINGFVFMLAAAMALAVAFVTVALQSMKTARANPVQALRYE